MRYEPLLVNYYGQAVPSMALLAAAKSLNLDAADIKLNAGRRRCRSASCKVRTDDAARMLPQFYNGARRPAGRSRSIPSTTCSRARSRRRKYADKIVLIGATAAGVGTPFPAPGDAAHHARWS